MASIGFRNARPYKKSKKKMRAKIFSWIRLRNLKVDIDELRFTRSLDDLTPDSKRTDYNQIIKYGIKDVEDIQSWMYIYVGAWVINLGTGCDIPF